MMAKEKVLPKVLSFDADLTQRDVQTIQGALLEERAAGYEEGLRRGGQLVVEAALRLQKPKPRLSAPNKPQTFPQPRAR